MAIKGYWKLNGNSNDYSGNGNNGTDTAITYSQANGRLNQGAGFNGSSSRIVNSTITNFQTKTISAWIKTGISNAYQDIFCQQNVVSGSNYSASEFRLTNTGKLNYTETQYPSGLGDGLISASNVPLNSWVHVAVVLNVNSCKLYVNGKNTDSKTLASRINVFTPYSSIIGAFQWTNGGAYSNFFNGSIDEVIIDNTAWSAAKVKNEYYRIKGFF